MTPDPTSRDPLERDLHELADRLTPPAVAVGDDLRRGRRRAVRQRLAVGGAAVATAGVLVLGFALLPGSDDDVAVGPAGGGDTPTAPETTPPVSPAESEVPTATPTEPAPPDDSDPFGMPASDRPLLVAIRRAVAGHLDPSGDHIGSREIKQANESGSAEGGEWTSIVQKIGWTNPGEDGQGLISVGVHTAFDVDCGGHYEGGGATTCTDTDLAGLPVTRVESPEEGDALYYSRPDGYVTSIAIDDLFGNNSTTAVSGIDVTDAPLAAVLGDPALDIPGHPAPRTLDVVPGTELRDAARAVLGGSITGFETWSGTTGGSWWADVRSADGTTGEVQLSDGLGNFEVDAPCDRGFATRCAFRTVGGRAVRVDYRRNSTGGGFDVTYDGPERPIWVAVSPDSSGRTSLSVDRAVRLASEPRLQR